MRDAGFHGDGPDSGRIKLLACPEYCDDNSGSSEVTDAAISHIVDRCPLGHVIRLHLNTPPAAAAAV